MLSQSSIQALARLRAYTPPPTQWYNCPLTRRAAVLILLFPDRHGELKVVLTMRAATLRNYAGQAALPGGKADALEDTPFDTARREASEEIGLPTTNAKLPAGFKVEHLCELPANLAKTELGVRPCVAYLSPSSAATATTPQDQGGSSTTTTTATDVESQMIPRLDPKEVAAVFTAPFHNFLCDKWEGRNGTPGPRSTTGKPHSWYRGSWTDWHESRWRMHNFYVPRPGGEASSGEASSAGTQLRSNPKHTSAKQPQPQPWSGPSSGSKPSSRGAEPNNSSNNSQPLPEGDDPRPEPAAFEELSTFRVFGMTARILVDAARVAYGEEPRFEHNSHHGDEEMIGRLLKVGRLSEVRRKGEELTREVLREAVRGGAGPQSKM